ncbi:MAG: hypothetical protein IJT59_00655 [Desulfovibrionaceae bacterium]|nr:hypothetical protein [Desulfovibrionaceae bacterium]
MALAYDHNQNNPNSINSIYSNLSTSTERLAIGLWVNFAFNDTSNLAIKELMRADIASLREEICASCQDLPHTVQGNLHNASHKNGSSNPSIKTSPDTRVNKSSHMQFQEKMATIEAIISATKSKQMNTIAAITNTDQHPNIDYSFDFEISYTGNAKILSEAYAINKLTFLGSEDSFEFKKGRANSESKFYPNIKIVDEHHEDNNGSVYYTYDLNFGDEDDSGIKYTAKFDCLDFDISAFKVSYQRNRIH